MVESRSVDSTRHCNAAVATVQEFRTQSIRVIDKYLEQPEADRRKRL